MTKRVNEKEECRQTSKTFWSNVELYLYEELDFQVYVIDSCEKSDTLQYWNHFCEIVEILLDCIKANGTGLSSHCTYRYFFKNAAVYFYSTIIFQVISFLLRMHEASSSMYTELEFGFFSVKLSPLKLNHV